MAKTQKKKKSGDFKREFIEVGIFFVVASVFYMMGWHTKIIGTLKRGLLATRIIQPDTRLDESELIKAKFNMPLIILR